MGPPHNAFHQLGRDLGRGHVHYHYLLDEDEDGWTEGWGGKGDGGMPLSDEDIEKIVVAIQTNGHITDCRFKHISAEDIKASVDFYKHANKVLTESSSTIRNTFLVAIIVALTGLIWLGFLGKVKVGGP